MTQDFFNDPDVPPTNGQDDDVDVWEDDGGHVTQMNDRSVVMIERATIDIVKDAESLSAEARDRLGKYLDDFLAPTFKYKDDEPTAITCPACDSHIYCGGILDALLSKFQWGIVHGDGFCSECDWPFRMYHYIKLDGDEEQRFCFPLAYRTFKDDERTIEIDPAMNQIGTPQ